MENEVESVKNLDVAGQEEVVENITEEVTDTLENTVEVTAEQEDNMTEDDKLELSDENISKNEQTKEDNKYARLARLKAEEKAKQEIEKVRKEAYEQGLQQGKVQSYIGKQNPYTGEVINDDYDVQEYLEMYELDSKGKDPIAGFRELQKEKARKEAEEKIKVEERNKQDMWYQNDTRDFVDKYSTEKLQELTEDVDFNLFANGKIGSVPLAQIYEDYQKLISKYEKKSVETAKKIVANNGVTPGPIEEGEAQDLNWNSMSTEQFEKYIQKAKDGELK